MRWDQLDPPEVTAELPWGIPAAATSSRFVRLMTAVNGIKPRTSSLNEVQPLLSPAADVAATQRAYPPARLLGCWFLRTWRASSLCSRTRPAL